MTIELLHEADVALPGAGQVIFFINLDKNNMLYARYPDGSFSPVNSVAGGSQTEIVKAWMDAIACGLTSGMVSPSEFESIMSQGITVEANSSTDENGNFTSTISVGSRNKSLTDFTVDTLIVGLTVGSPTKQIITTFTPSDATNRSVTYVSSDETKATVSSTGLITRVANGTCNVTVIPEGNPSKTKVIAVTTTA